MTDTTQLRPALAPYIAREQSKDATNVASFQREAARRRGVTFAGSAPLEQPVVRAEGALVAAATAAYDRDQEWKKSPKGRLSYAIHAICEAGYQHTAERMRGAYSRSVSMAEKPSMQALGFLLTELASIPLIDASLRGAVQSATKAIADMLGADEQRVA